jgi:hypothetical protein
MVKLVDLVRELRKQQIIGTEYLGTLPHEFQTLLIENKHAESMWEAQSHLLKAVFGEWYEDVYWFLWEFTPGKTPGPHLALADGTEFVYNTDEDYYAYFEKLTEGKK